jgi:glycosyltransferase involved in cell wall biosynthesis
MTPLFSIVIPTLNRAHVIGRAIRSCLAQTCPDYEIIVVDDEKSSDEIGVALGPFAGAPLTLVAGHRGRAGAARNTGARLARGEYVAFLDADDLFLPDKLETCLAALERSPGSLVYSQTYVDRGVRRWWIKPGRGLRPDEPVFDYLFAADGWVHPSTVAVATRLARDHPFDVRLGFGDDLQFAADLWCGGTPLAMIERPLAVYEDHHRADRLSQTPVFRPDGTPEHDSFVDWVETRRPQMSERAYRGYRARVLSRFVAARSPAAAGRCIFDAYRSDVLSLRQSLMQGVQTFAPGIYRRCADAVTAVAGVLPPSNVDGARRPPSVGLDDSEAIA